MSGNSAERLVEYVLSRIAYVTKIDSPNDVGIDLYCIIYKTNETKVSPTGARFAVQVKNRETDSEIELSAENFNHIVYFPMPYFLCVTSGSKIKFYSCQQLIYLREIYGAMNAGKLELIPKDNIESDELTALPASSKISFPNKVNVGPCFLEFDISDITNILDLKIKLENGTEIFREDLTNKFKERTNLESATILDVNTYLPLVFFYDANNTVIGYTKEPIYHPQNYEHEVYKRLLPRLAMYYYHKNKTKSRFFTQTKITGDQFLDDILSKINRNERKNRYWYEFFLREYDRFKKKK